MLTTLTLYGLSIQIETKDEKLQYLISRFIEEYYTSQQKGFGFNAPEQVEQYISYIEDQQAVLMPNKQFKHFLYFLKTRGYEFKDYTLVDKKNTNPTKGNYKVKSNWKIRDNQIPCRDFIENDPKGNKLLPLTMGTGKTFIALNSLANIGDKFCVLIMPTFTEKWISDILEIHESERQEICVINGSPDKSIFTIEKLIKQVKEYGEVPWRYFILSLVSFRNYITKFETNSEAAMEEYGCSPQELFPLLGVGSLLVDETHLAFNSLFKCLTYSNVKFQLGLSATLIPTNALEDRVYKCIYEGDEIFPDKMIKKYIKCYPVGFNANRERVKKLRWTNNFRQKNKGAYNHTAYEKSIMKSPELLRNYVAIIRETFDALYISDKMEKDKCVIFVATIKMVRYLTELFATLYPSLNVQGYCEDDSYEEMLKADVIFSTIGSAGTGIDIPHLRVAIQTVSVSSPKSNLQTLGRLRVLSDRDVKFAYLYCFQIQKQMGHHKERMDIFKEHIVSCEGLRSSIEL